MLRVLFLAIFRPDALHRETVVRRQQVHHAICEKEDEYEFHSVCEDVGRRILRRDGERS